MEDAKFEAAVSRLKRELDLVPTNRALYTMIGAKDKVTGRFGALFSPGALDTLDAEDFRRFLYLEHNYHWSQLYRRGNGAADDIGALRKGLKILLDEGRDIADRWNGTQVRGLGKAIKSALLMVVYPERYGVWNGVS